MSRAHSRVFEFALAIVIVFSLLPLITHAQAANTEDDLHVAIWSSLLSDPRTANIPPAQLTALVDALALQAQAQNVSAAEIASRPQSEQAFGGAQPAVDEAAQCASTMFPYLCSFNSAFGFSGNDISTPLIFIVTSLILILLIKRMMKAHKEHEVKVAATAPPWTTM